MNSRKLLPRVAFLSIATLGCVVALVSSVAFAADANEKAKLKALERALATPVEQTEEFSQKAIVFDKDQDAGAAKPPVAAAAGSMDCSQLPSDIKTTAVDFEIQFKLGSADLSPVSENTLVQIAKILALTPERCVFVEGHTDAKGNADANLKLSRERANTVANYIVSKAGINRSRLITEGKGSSEPLRNLDPRDSKNRRVVFKVVG